MFVNQDGSRFSVILTKLIRSKTISDVSWMCGDLICCFWIKIRILLIVFNRLMISVFHLLKFLFFWLRHACTTIIISIVVECRVYDRLLHKKWIFGRVPFEPRPIWLSSKILIERWLVRSRSVLIFWIIHWF